MSKNESDYFRNGLFNISANRKVSGTISLNGPDSILHLWADDSFKVDEAEAATITGILDNQEKVSLIECLKTYEQSFFGTEGVSHHEKFFPHYVIIGNRYFSHSDKDILNISFLVDNAKMLFHDMQSFGTIILTPDKLERLSESDIFRKIPFTKDQPHIAYYTGKHKIFSANTVVGKISARHSPTFYSAGALTGYA